MFRLLYERLRGLMHDLERPRSATRSNTMVPVSAMQASLSAAIHLQKGKYTDAVSAILHSSFSNVVGDLAIFRNEFTNNDEFREVIVGCGPHLFHTNENRIKANRLFMAICDHPDGQNLFDSILSTNIGHYHSMMGSFDDLVRTSYPDMATLVNSTNEYVKMPRITKKQIDDIATAAGIPGFAAAIERTKDGQFFVLPPKEGLLMVNSLSVAAIKRIMAIVDEMGYNEIYAKVLAEEILPANILSLHTILILRGIIKNEPINEVIRIYYTNMETRAERILAIPNHKLPANVKPYTGIDIYRSALYLERSGKLSLK